MVTKYTILSVAVILLLGFTIGAQESLYVKPDDKSIMPIQRFAWSAVDNSNYYEIIVEEQKDAIYTEILRKQIKDNFIECSLASGRYRYQVIAYNFFNQPGRASDWVYFEVLRVLPPELIRISPKTFFYDKKNRLVVTVTGHNLKAESKLYLHPQNGDRTIAPLRSVFHDSGNRAVLEFDPQSLEPGGYDLTVKNPDGLEASLSGFSVRASPLDITFQALYGPLFSLPASKFNRLYNMQFLPAGVSVRAGLIPVRGKSLAFGFELNPFWNYLSSQVNDDYSVYAQFIGLQGGPLLQLWLPGRTLGFNFRVGGGFSMIGDFHFVNSKNEPIEESFTTWMPSAYGGITFMWHINRTFFVEGGAEFLHLFSIDQSLEFIRPTLGAGVRF
jgi:hypothetical protein